MRKSCRWLCLFAVTFFTRANIISQTSAVSKNQVSISIAGIEYDDAGFTALKESINKNVKAQNIKQSFSENTGKLSLLYPGDATQLWDELPASAKQPFKITTLEGTRIELKLKNAVTTAQPASTDKTAATPKNDDCKNCYWNLCKYDGLKSFQGVIFKQINKDDGTYYYNCDNGVVVVKQVFVNGYGVTTNIKSDTLLVSSGPVGTQWGVQSSNTSFLGIKSKYETSNTLIAKGVTTAVNGATYTDVIVVNRKNFSSDNILNNNTEPTSVNEYYARGVGLIKTENADPHKDAMEALNKSKAFENLPGSIDNSIVGSWKHNDESGMTFTYKFKSDGTYDYYVGQDKWFKDLTCYWKVDGNKLVITRTDLSDNYSFVLKKENDKTTGKPKLIIQFRGDEYRDYISLDNHAPWK